MSKTGYCPLGVYSLGESVYLGESRSAQPRICRMFLDVKNPDLQNVP